MTLPARRERTATGRAATLLRTEAKVLGRARHPGVEELVEFDDDGDAVRVSTVWVPGRHPSEAVRSLEEAAGVMATLATTIADLHDIGIVHGAIDDSSVVVADHGAPMLVGFESASILDGPARQWATSDAVANDRAAMGTLLRQLVAALERSDTPRGTGAGTGGRAGLSARKYPPRPSAPLIRLSERASPGRKARIPLTARGLAGALAMFPGATLPRQDSGMPSAGRTSPRQNEGARPVTSEGLTTDTPATEWDLDPTRARPRPFCIPDRRVGWARRWPNRDTHLHRERTLHATRRALPALAAIAATVLIGFGVNGVPLVGAALRSSAASGSHRARSAANPSATSLPPAPMPASFADGVLRVGAARYAVGDPGDVILVGRWTCTLASVALLRRRDATVWVFPGWPSPANSVAAALVGRVDGAVSAELRPVGPCDAIRAHRTDGSSVVLGPWKGGR